MVPPIAHLPTVCQLVLLKNLAILLAGLTYQCIPVGVGGLMYFTFHYLPGYIIIALGIGMIILSYFVGWNPRGWAIFGAGLANIGAGFAYLWG